jgi:hypothetical protein
MWYVSPTQLHAIWLDGKPKFRKHMLFEDLDIKADSGVRICKICSTEISEDGLSILVIGQFVH